MYHATHYISICVMYIYSTLVVTDMYIAVSMHIASILHIIMYATFYY